MDVRIKRGPKGRLLILDINHVLIDRTEGGKRRAFVDDFLDLCFRSFDIMVWSCGVLFTPGGAPNDKFKNEMKLFQPWRDQIAAVWDQVHSTNLWPLNSPRIRASLCF